MTSAALLILALPLQELLSALEFNMDLQQAAQAPRTADSAEGWAEIYWQPSRDHRLVILHSLG